MSSKNIPYHRKPEELSLEEWQKELRKQFGKEQYFKFKNLGTHLVYSDFEVYNPASKNTYKVCLRDGIDSFNFCSCPDFKINALGTCKHIEYMLHYFQQFKKYSKHLANPHKPNLSSLSIYYGVERKIRLEKSQHIEQFENEENYFDNYGFLKPKMLENIETFIASSTKIDPDFVVYPDVLEHIEWHKKRRKDKVVSDRLFADGLQSAVFDSVINGKLYDYQKEGVRRIIQLGRILLADDMGLGKTIQTIAATEIFSKYYKVERVLIICPTSVKFQWKREIEKFTGRQAVIVEGRIHSRKDLYETSSFYKLVSFGVCSSDHELINSCQFDLIIIDEAQRIKNWKTKTAQSVKKIQSEYAIVLTGTPLENKIEELHSIVEYIDRYKLGPLFRYLHNHQILDDYGKLKGYKNLREIRSTLGDVLIRRTKAEIIDQLPGRIDKNFFVELTKEQRTDHDNYYNEVCQLVNKWIRQGFLSEPDKQTLLLDLNCMRMVCDSTYILNQKTNFGNKIEELRELLDELLLSPENKIVIFSQWKRMFELVINELDKLNIKYVYLNGDMSAKQRQEIIETFQSNQEYKVFLSTDAGGVGVNLQSANILINLDLAWNPAVLEQRIGRIYRLGQKKHVNVFNFIAKNSIEHRILYLLEFKRSVFAGVIEEEGKDTVMLDSFLETMKALTAINLEDNQNETPPAPNRFNNVISDEVQKHRIGVSDNKNGTNFTADSATVNNVKTPAKLSFFGLLKQRLQNFFKKIS